MSKFFAALFAVCLLASHSVSAQSYGWYFQGYEDSACATETSDFYELSTDISQSGASSYTLLTTATAATGIYLAESYADEAKAKPLPSITLPDPFTDATKIGCFEIKNVESQGSATGSGIYVQLVVDFTADPDTAVLNFYSDNKCATTLKNSGTAITATITEIGTGATPSKCYNPSADVTPSVPASSPKPIKSFAVVSATVSGVTTYTVYGYTDPVASGTTCVTTSGSIFSSTTTSIINACMLVGNYVASNVAGPVYAILNTIDTASSAKKYSAIFYSDSSCKTAHHATAQVIDFAVSPITTVQKLSDGKIYGKLASATAPYVFYTTSDAAGTTEFTVKYQTNLCQDVSSLAVGTKSVHFYFDIASDDVYAVGFSKITCTDDDTNVAEDSYPILLQDKDTATPTCQQVSSTVYAKIKQDSSDLTKYATTFYAKSDCTGTATSGLFVFAPKCTATGFSANEGSPYARLAFAVPPASNSGLLRFGLFALLASVIALIF